MRYEEALAAWQPRIVSALRIFTALEILQHGTSKFFGFPAFEAFANISVTSLYGVSGLFELVGGALILVGLFTRPVAFIMSGFTAVAYFLVHAPKSFFPLVNGGELAALYCFVFLFLAFTGGGPWSLDTLIAKKS